MLVLSANLDTALSANVDTIGLDVHEIRQHHGRSTHPEPELLNQQRKVGRVPLERDSAIGWCRDSRSYDPPGAVRFRAEVVPDFALRASMSSETSKQPGPRRSWDIFHLNMSAACSDGAPLSFTRSRATDNQPRLAELAQRE